MQIEYSVFVHTPARNVPPQKLENRVILGDAPIFIGGIPWYFLDKIFIICYY
jgi:hypothetical protein